MFVPLDEYLVGIDMVFGLSLLSVEVSYPY